jgi:hypothetical protein
MRDDRWERFRDLLPGWEWQVTAADNPRFVEAVLYRVARSAGALRRLEEGASALQQMGEHLSGDADNEYATIDRTIVRARQYSASAENRRRPSGRAIARWIEHQDPRPGDALGNPVGFFLTGGEAQDLVAADRPLPTMEADS